MAAIYCRCGHVGELRDPDLIERMMAQLYRPHLRCSACSAKTNRYEVRYSFIMPGSE